MCGIVGRVSRRALPPLNGAALEALRHRGPDMQRSQRWTAENGCWDLAFARLAIVDLSDSGAQPMSNEDNSLVMIFNGEIYNSPELRRECESAGHRFRSSMDGEVILHLWEMEGPAALARLNGIFAVAIASTVTGELFIARDPVGVKPLFYAASEDTLWFGSEIRALVAAGAPRGPLDLVALAQFLSFLWIPDPRTPYEGIRSLEPGHALHWSPNGVRTFRHSPALVPPESPEPLPRPRALSETRERLTAAVRRQLLGDVPIGLMASGGVDSSLIWWGAGTGIDRAFTIAWENDSGAEGLGDDAATVRDLERVLKTTVEYIVPTTVGETAALSGDLFADPAHDLTRMIAEPASRRGYKVLMSGQGGDELFAGYRRHRIAPLLARARTGSAGRAVESLLTRTGSGRVHVEYLARLARATAERDPFRAYMQLCTYSSADDRARVLGCGTSEVSDDVMWGRHHQVYGALPNGLSYLRKVMTLDLAVYLPGLGLAYVDRAGMEFGVEVRVPWLDLDFLRWTLTLPDEMLVRRGRGKWIPRRIVAQEMSAHAANRPKRGFAAPAEHLRRSRRPESARGFRQSQYFARAQRMLRDFVETNADVPMLVGTSRTQ